MARLPRNPVLLDEDLTAAVDRVRGDLNRSEFVRNVLRRSLAARGESVPPFQTVVGKYDRAEKRLIKSTSLAAREKRKRRRAWGRANTAKWRERVAAKKASAVEAATNPHVEVWPDGSLTVLSPSGGSSQSLGYISQSGELMLETSRFPRAGVVAAIVRVLDDDTANRLRGDRFERFRAMVVDG